MNSIKVKLTPEQIVVLRPLFNQVSEYNLTHQGKLGCAIFAQIYKDGLVAKFSDNEESLRIQNSFGTIPPDYKNAMASSLEERFSLEHVIATYKAK